VGYTSTLADPHAKKLITDLVPEGELVWPVGRLDKDTSGLIIMTNDGELTQKLTHPKYEKSKTYVATLDHSLTSKECDDIESGIELEDGRVKADKLIAISSKEYEITVHEGRNRLVRRIFEHFGKKVILLQRTKLSFLEMGNLRPGDFRRLNKQEIERLKNA
jgi:23S rRNA pseudouridine2605 synthase